MADIVDTLKAWAAWYADNSSDMPSGSLPAAMLNAVTEIERLRALIIEWDAAFFGRRGVGDWLPEVSLVNAEFALHEEARRG